MPARSTPVFVSFLFLSALVFIYSCSKNSGGGNMNPCSGVTISVSGTSSNTSSPGAADGSLSITASGGSGLTYKLNSGAFQSSGNFTGLAAGTYTITAKDAQGCTGTAQFTIAANDPCTAVNFTVSATSTPGTPCSGADGTATVSVSGSGSGFTFNINNGSFGSATTFANLAPGNYTIGAKEAGGCVRTTTVTVAAKPAGTLFSDVKNIIGTNCALSSCHGGTQAPNFTVDCNIIANASLIKQRAVDGSPSFMPPTGSQLSQADKDKIVSWINAGGGYTN